jgi:hypothetical protein
MKRRILIFCISVLALTKISSCANKLVILDTAEVTPTSITVTETPKIFPTAKSGIMPVEKPRLKNPIDLNNIEEFWYTPLIYYPFPFTNISAPLIWGDNDLYLKVTRMYKEHRWADKGLEITTNQGDILEIRKNITFQDEVSFSFYKNEDKTGTILTPPGMLFDIMTTSPDTGSAFTWCHYAPDLDSCVGIDENFEQLITYYPMNSIYLYVDEDWVPTLEEYQIKVLCKNQRYDLRGLGIDVPEEEYDRVRSLLLTYRYPDEGLIFQWGPEPMPCPIGKISVVYPTN